MQSIILPTEKQMKFLDWEMGVFFHFGIRTFYEGHKDWDMKEMSVSQFNPVGLDCGQWIETAAKAGAKYAILVCKHHDGFANWPSAYTGYCVRHTPWKNGQGDVVREYVDACRKYGLGVGLYYSPAEFGSSDRGSKDYDAYFINQISELLSNYGTIDYLWFDGCGSEGHTYDTVRIINTIRSLQPNILIFNMWDPDTRWVGNESGYAHMSNPYLVSSLAFSVLAEKNERLSEQLFLPAECDFRMRRHHWFYSDSDEETVKTMEELMGIYYYSVGRGANLLINIGPDRRGLLPEKDANRLIEFGQEVQRRFAKALPCETAVEGREYSCQLDKPQLVNHVVLFEDIRQGSVIERFRIEAYPYNYGDPITVYRGETIGRKNICLFADFYTDKIKVVIESGNDCAKLNKVDLHFVENKR